MYCHNCGNKLKEGQKFCPQCGTPFNGSKGATTDGKVDLSPQNDVSNDSNPNIEKGNVVSQHSESKEVNPIHDANQKSSQSEVADETTINAPENTPLNEDEVKKYGNLKKGLKWGGFIMAIILGGSSLSNFSWFSLIMYAALCYIVYNAFFGKEEGKTLADFNLLKLKTFICLGLCLTLFMYGPKGGVSGSGDPYEEAYKIGYDYGYQWSGYSKITTGQIRVAFNNEYDTQGASVEHANKLYSEFEKGARKGYSDGKKVYNN